MLNKNLKFKRPIFLFGNGEVPDNPLALKKLFQSESIICVDGGTDKLLKLGLNAKLILGDMDSLNSDIETYKTDFFRLNDQSKTDLEKSLEWCIESKIEELSLIGFSGARDDHAMNTLLAIQSFALQIDITYYTNYSIIKCVRDRATFKTYPGQIISIIPNSEDIKITTSGLAYPLKSTILKSPGHGISNIAKGPEFSINSNKLVWIFFNIDALGQTKKE